MSEESFDDISIASALNASFVAIKVDREEHPDVDAIFMGATQALTGQGGWPNSVWCTPTGEPFFAGTYFPREPRGGLPGFKELLTALADAWTNRRPEVLESGATIARELAPLQSVSVVNDVDLRAARQSVLDQFDPITGGFGGAPKFPPAMLIDALLVSGDAGELEAAQHTLEAMARGGLHDQLGGGFHRYCVDAAWVVPHFEKMLYDNALLLGAYTRGWRRTPEHSSWQRGLFADVVERLVGWLQREMLLPTGAFAASLDADSADIRGMAHEGIYYCWNPELLTDALGEDDGDWAASVFHVTQSGTFQHGLSTLQLKGHPEAERLARVRSVLFHVREGRFHPQRDDKAVACWNGLALDALVEAAMVFGRPNWLHLARGVAEALWGMWDGETLARSVRDEVRGPAGVTEDYAAVALGLARFAGATGERQWLDRAVLLLERAEELFAAEDGGWFDAATSTELFVRPRDVTDTATPSATSVMVLALRLVGLLAERDDLLARADDAALTQRGILASLPRHAGWALYAAIIADEARRGLKPATVVTVTPDGDPQAELVRAVWRIAPFGSALLTACDGATWGELVTGRPAREGAATVYICRGQTCFAPVTEVAELKTPLWCRVS